MAEKPISVVPKSWRFILALWIPVWAFFLGLSVYRDPSSLIRSLRLIPAAPDARRAWVYGEELDEFLRFCKSKLPEGSTFRLVGIDYGSVDRVRAYYFLYPSLLDEHPQFILVYQTPDHREDNTSLYAGLSPSSFILRSAEPSNP